MTESTMFLKLHLPRYVDGFEISQIFQDFFINRRIYFDDGEGFFAEAEARDVDVYMIQTLIMIVDETGAIRLLPEIHFEKSHQLFRK